MKKILYISILVFFFACSDKKEPLQLFSPEAFAYTLDSGWELNASVRVRNFTQENEDDKYQAKLSYSVDLVKPSGEKISDVDDGIIDESSEEEFQDLPIELQLELSDSYQTGSYSLIFKVTDDYSSETDTLSQPFILSSD